VVSLLVTYRFQGHHSKLPFSYVSPDGTMGTVAPDVLPRLLPGSSSSTCGTALLEVCVGAYASPSKPLLVVDDEALANEMQQMLRICSAQKPGFTTDASFSSEVQAACRLSSEQRDEVLMDMGLALQQQHASGSTGCLLSQQEVGLKAAQLLSFACDMGWVRCASRLLPIAIRYQGGSLGIVKGEKLVASMDGCCSRADSSKAKFPAVEELSLIHRAVRSGNLLLVAGLLQWSQQYKMAVQARCPVEACLKVLDDECLGDCEPCTDECPQACSGAASCCPLQTAGCCSAAASAASPLPPLPLWVSNQRADVRGPGGLTPLHLAAFLRDARVAVVLLGNCPAAAFTR
jgi:hypothetical protein